MALFLDVTPLREHPAYRRLYGGFTLSNVGSQLAIVAIGLQVYDLTGSTGAVGLVGLFAFVPLVVMGLYGGSLVDHHDRRSVGLVAQSVSFAASVICAAQAWLGNTSVWVLYLVVTVWNAGYAVSSPARSAIYPRILPREQLPAANALQVAAMNTSLTAGPLLAGMLVHWGGFRTAYTVDVVVTIAALWALWTLHPIPPEPAEAGAPPSRPGLTSVVDGFRFLATRPNVRMTFLADICAMVTAAPRVLFPAAGAVIFGGDARTVGYLGAAAAVGGFTAMAFSGPLGRIRRQGLAIIVSIVGWGFAIAGFGVSMLMAGGALSRPHALWLALTCMAFAGASDAVSAVFRSTILQSATPDRLRGRLQGVFIVVVAGGPRIGDGLAGFVADVIGEGRTALVGGLVCVVAILLLARWQRGFLHYDARHPVP